MRKVHVRGSKWRRTDKTNPSGGRPMPPSFKMAGHSRPHRSCLQTRLILLQHTYEGEPMRVLLVEDEVRLADNLSAALRDGPGFAVDWAADGEAGDDSARNLCYDLVILDLMLPKLDGSGVLRRMRARKDSTPVLILTAKEGKDTIIHLLNSGADDYLAKPFDLGELLARAKALIRRGKGASHPTLSALGVTLNTLEQTVHRGSVLVDLSPTEYHILEYL